MAEPRELQDTTSKSLGCAWHYLVGVAAVICYAVVIATHVFNMPKWDDYPEILDFMQRWLASSTPLEQMQVLFSRTNEHVLLVNHLLTLVEYYLLGRIDFTGLVTIGNVIFIASACALWLLVRRDKHDSFAFMLVMLLCVNFYTYDSLLWAMTSISNQAVILFAWLAILLATRQAPLGSVMLMSTLAILSQSNGMFILPVLGVWFYQQHKRSHLLAWLVYSVAIVAVYIMCYLLKQPESSTAVETLHIPPLHYFAMLPAFVAYFGAVIFSKASMLSFTLAFIVGGAILFLLAQGLRKKIYSDAQTLAIGFILLCVASIVAYRGLAIGPAVIFTSRYKMYGSALIAIVVLAALRRNPDTHNPRQSMAALCIALAFYGWSFIDNLPQQEIIDGDLHASLQRWIVDGDLRRGRGFFTRNADGYLFASVKNGTYNPLVLLPQPHILQAKRSDTCPAPTASTLADGASINISHRNPNAVGIVIQSTLATESTLWLCADSSNYQIAVPVMLTHATSDQQTLDYVVPREQIAAGNYTVLLQQANVVSRHPDMFINKPNTR